MYGFRLNRMKNGPHSDILIIMTKEERQKQIIEAVKRIIAQKGMNGFSIRQAAEMTGINEALIYRDFYTKDQLLEACYQSVEDAIYQIYANIGPLDLSTPEQNLNAMREMWMKSFCFLLEHKDDTLFIRSYRESSYRQKLLKAGAKRQPKYFFEARDKFASVLPKNLDMHLTWVYVIDIAIEFAVKILQGKLPNTEEAITKIWLLMYQGLSQSVFRE